MSISMYEWSKVALAFAVGVSLSAGYVALGIHGAPAPTVVVEERCAEQLEQLRELAPAPQEAESEAELHPELLRDPPFYGMSEARLEAMAKTCQLRDDHPPTLDDNIAKALGLDADEREAWDNALGGLEGKEAFMHFFVINSIDESIEVSKLSIDEQRALIAERIEETKRPEDTSVYTHLAEERAGMRPEPSKAELREMSAWARWERHQLTRGDRFAALLAKELGQKRVDELRRTFNGWPGHEGVQRAGCDDDPEDRVEGYVSDKGLDKAMIRRIVVAHISDIRSCYNTGLSEDPKLAGRVLVSFTIDPDGKVPRSEIIDGTTLGHPQTEQCIADAMRDWLFPRPSTGESVNVTYPFVLEPG